MTDPIEAVARAICVELGIDPDKMTYDIISGKDIPAWRIEANVARAAIAAYQQAVAGEAVVWQYRSEYGSKKFTPWTEDSLENCLRWKSKDEGTEIRPLFAAPPVPKPESAPAIPAGWKLVPVEPDENMKNAVQKLGGAQALFYVLAGWGTMLEAAPPAPAVTDGWLPIETAPKDEETFLAVQQGWIERWHPYEPACVITTKASKSATMCWRCANGSFVDWTGEVYTEHGIVLDAEDDDDEPLRLTHWMPLPAAPTPEAENE